MSNSSSKTLKLQHRHQRTASILDLCTLENFKSESDHERDYQEYKINMLITENTKGECTLEELTQLMIKITKATETKNMRIDERKRKIRNKVLKLYSSSKLGSKPKPPKSKVFAPILSKHKLPQPSSQNTSASGKRPCSSSSRGTRKSHSSSASMKTPPKQIKNLLQTKTKNP